MYYTIKEMINRYIVYMKQINGDEYVDTTKLNMTQEEIRKALQNDGISAVKSLLDEQYIKDLNITDNQIKEEQNKYKQKGNYNEETIYKLNIQDVMTSNISETIVVALINANLNNKELKLMIKLDKKNNTYSIFLEDYIKKYNYNKEMEQKDINISQNEIQKNDYNGDINIEASESYIVSQYFSEYRMKMLYDTEEAYKLLDAEYSQKKYGNYQNFKNYISNNKEKIKLSSIKKYQINEHNGTKEYVCIDNNGKYYIFLESALTKYKVVLDTYTIDVPSFLEKYNNNEDEIKVGLNIQKVFDAINDNDYQYVYNKLDNTFKQNNFPNKESFEKYVKENFAHNQLNYENYQKSGNLYIFDVTVTEGTESNKNGVRKKFIMKLLEGTDFVMSFNVK